MKLQELLDSSKLSKPEFNFDLAEMKEACAGPSYSIPKEALESFKTFQAFMLKGSNEN